jgi:integrase
MAWIETRQLARKDPRTGRPAKSYTVIWRDRTGRQRQRTFHNKKLAEAHHGKVADPDDVAPSDARRAKPRFREVAGRWLENASVKDSTRTRYGQLLITHVDPFFGDLPIAEITPIDVDDWLSAMRHKRVGSKPIRPATVVRAFGVLRGVMKYALLLRLIESVPTTGFTMPTASTMKQTEFEGRHLSVAEVDAVCEALGEDWYSQLLVRFLAYTGLRAGEMAGLNIGDYDRQSNIKMLTVRRTWSHGALTEPKSRASRRRVPVDPDLVPLLRDYLLVHPDSGNPDSPLFLPWKNGGTYAVHRIWPDTQPTSKPRKPRPFQPGKRWDPASFYRTSFRVACAMAEVGHVRLHDLRHTFASEQLRAGNTLFEVKELMGHADIQLVARTYGHLSQDSAVQAITRTAAARQMSRAPAITRA